MKLLFLSSFYPPLTRGGAEISTHYLAQALVQRGHDVTVITAGPKAARQKFDGVSVCRLPLPFAAKPLFEERHSRKVARQLLRQVDNLDTYDIVHVHDFRMMGVAAELPVQHRMVTMRDYASICGTTNSILADGTIQPVRTLADAWKSQRLLEASWVRKPFRLWQYLYNLNYRAQSFAKADTYIYISHAQRRLIEQYQTIIPAHAQVIYNPVGDMFLNAENIQVSQQQGLLYVGTVENYKGVGLLIAAFEKLVKEFPHAQLTIVGEGAQKNSYERHVDQAGLSYKVHFKSRLPHDGLITLYDQADIIVAPQLWIEPFGRTVAEAMARRKIVVSANCGGPAEMIVDGKTGILFERGSVDGLVAALRRALQIKDIDRREMQSAAHAWVANHLSQAIIAAQYEEIYQKVV